MLSGARMQAVASDALVRFRSQSDDTNRPEQTISFVGYGRLRVKSRIPGKWTPTRLVMATAIVRRP